jgi:hypothetical protein
MPCLTRSAWSTFRSKVIAPLILTSCDLMVRGRALLQDASHLSPSPEQLTSVASKTNNGPQPNCPLSATCRPFPASVLTSIITNGTGNANQSSRPAEIGQKLPLASEPRPSALGCLLPPRTNQICRIISLAQGLSGAL